jgi:regulator of protease activity HflC (stomatin/prohibitin superfamily)
VESLIIAGALVLIAMLVVFSTIKIVPQAQAGIVERLGRYQRTLDPGLTIIIPFVDRLRPLIDLREQVVSFAPQPVITSDNLVVSIDSVIYFQVTDAKAATYEIENYLQGVEQLTVTTLRNVVGSLDLEQTLTSRDNINAQLRGVLDEATGKWGIRVNRVELKAIDPPASVQQSMEKQMRADRDKRAAILNAEGSKQAAILDAEGSRSAAILKAEGQAQAQVLRARGEAEAIAKVFDAINNGNATDQVMAYQYLQSLPLLAQGSANKVFVIPAELSSALGAVSRAFAPPAPAPGPTGRGDEPDLSPTVDVEPIDDESTTDEDSDIVEAVVVEPSNAAPKSAARSSRSAPRTKQASGTKGAPPASKS